MLKNVYLTKSVISSVTEECKFISNLGMGIIFIEKPTNTFKNLVLL
jgi:hypothetical protein